MLQLHFWELSGKDFTHDLPPQPPACQDIRFVRACHRQRRAMLLRHGAGDSCNALDLGPRVFPRVRGIVGFLSFGTKVCATTIFAQDDKVGVLDDLALQRGQVQEGARIEGARANVGKGVEMLAELEEARLWVGICCAPVSRSKSVTGASVDGFPTRKNSDSLPFRTTDAAKENGVGFCCFLKDGVGDGSAVRVNGAATCQVVRKMELGARARLHNFQNFESFSHNFWTNMVTRQDEDIS